MFHSTRPIKSFFLFRQFITNHSSIFSLTAWKIKADRPLTSDTLNATWLLTDNSSGLVVVIRNYHWLNLISTCSAPLFQTGERKQMHNFSLFDFDLWPTTLTYNPRLAKVKINPHAKNQGQRSNGSNKRVPTDRQDRHTHTHTHGRYQTYYLPWYAVDNNQSTSPFFWVSSNSL